jgi:hypothetical protein
MEDDKTSIFSHICYMIGIWLCLLIYDTAGYFLFTKGLTIIEVIEGYQYSIVDNKILAVIIYIYLHPIFILFEGYEYKEDYVIATYLLIGHLIVYFFTYDIFLSVKENKYKYNDFF